MFLISEKPKNSNIKNEILLQIDLKNILGILEKYTDISCHELCNNKINTSIKHLFNWSHIFLKII